MKKKSQNKIITYSFLSFLAAASLLSVLWPKQGFSPSENRYLQKKPEFTVTGLLDGSYGTAYERFLSDQFPARTGWIGLKVAAERVQGKKDVNGVYFGKQDYLMEKFDTEDVEGEQLDKNLGWLKSFVLGARERLGEERVRVMLVPTASQVLKDKLPFLAAPYDQSKVAKRLEDSLGTELVVPVEEALAQHSQEALYYKTDHHWTALGAYYGYEAWALSVGLTPWRQSEFHIETVSEDFLGTVYSKVNGSQKPDSIALYLPKEAVSYEIYYDGAKEPSDMYTYQALEGKDKYAVYMDGNHGLTEVKNQSPSLDTDRRLLVIKDSFAHSFAPFAVNHFAETYMIDLRYFNQNPQIFMEEKGITDVLILYQIPGFAKEKTVSKLNAAFRQDSIINTD